MKTKRTLYVKGLKFGVIILVVSFLLFPLVAIAQVDVTPPVFLGFTINPVVFDAGIADVNIEACVTAADDLSGLNWAAVALTIDGWTFENVIRDFLPGNDTVCIPLVVPQFFQYGTMSVRVVLTDNIPNGREIEAFELCSLGFNCELLNRASTNLPDSDSDGFPDDADNCPDDANPGQEDRDLDLIGDVCDPFPDDRDNEKAQCAADLAQALIDLEECLNVCTPTHNKEKGPRCTDGLDNDCDGMMDSEDPDCQ